MKCAHEKLLKNGVTQVTLSTADFQAPEFYKKKFGYTIYFRHCLGDALGSDNFLYKDLKPLKLKNGNILCL